MKTLLLLLISVSLFASAPKKALIFGVTGQDGAYLSELLLKKGYIVHGVKRRASSLNTERIDHLYQDPHITGTRFFLHYGDLSDATCISQLISRIDPDEIYNLAAQSDVRTSFDLPEYTGDVTGIGTLRILESIRQLDKTKKVRFYQASTSELFGLVQEIPQTEKTPFYPRSPYACAKLYAHWITINYREAYGMYACCGILFNHESPRRGETFVTRKITRAVASIVSGTQDTLYLGNLDSKRDWGFAGDYVHAMWSMLQQDKPDDFVIATGETHSVREFVELAFKEAGVDIIWKGEGLDEVGIDIASGKTLIKIDPRYFRPAEVDLLLGSAEKAAQKLGWQIKTAFPDLIKLMVASDLKKYKH